LASGALDPVEIVSTTGNGDGGPQIAINKHGNALIAWMHHNGSRSSVKLRRRSSSGNLNEVQRVSPERVDAWYFHIAIDADNNAWVVWQVHTSWVTPDHVRHDAYFVQLRRRSAWGHLGPAQALSEAGRRAHNPPVAIAAGSSALAVWSEFDGINWRVRAASRP
jgi:hypothetical protein